MFDNALNVEDALKQVGTVISRKDAGEAINASEIHAVFSKKVECDECGKKSILNQCVKLIDGGFDLKCPHCGTSHPVTIIIAG